MKITKLLFISIISLLSLYPVESLLLPDVSNDNISPPTFSKESGFYDSDFELTLTSSEKILYTLDGSDPLNSKTASEYSSPIKITDRSGEPNIYSEYQEDENSPQSVSRRNGYKKPKHLVDKATVVRAVTKSSGGSSKVVDKTYFITSNNLAKYQDLTVISIVTNPDNLFDPEKGIYVTGNQFIQWKNSGDFNGGKNPWDTDNKCNYFGKGKEWEREASITIFEKGKIILQENAGLSLKGASTRNNPGKSFEIKAKKKYGVNLFTCENLLPDNVDVNGKKISVYKSFALRSVYEEGRYKDRIARDIIGNRVNISTQQMKDAIVFLDGEYWGLYEIMEQFSSGYFLNHFGIPADDVTVIKENKVKDGNEEEGSKYLQMSETYASKDLTDKSNYEEITKFFDVDSIIEHYAIGIYLGTSDWPTQNSGLWKNTGSQIDGNPFSDGKWRFMSFDFDYTMGASFGGGGPNSNNFQHIEQRKDKAPTNIFLALLKNEEFKYRFASIYCDYANEVFNPDKVKKIMSGYTADIIELVANSQVRWWGCDNDLMQCFAGYKNKFENNLKSIQQYFNERAKNTLAHMKQYLNLKGELQELTVSIVGNGKVQINTITPEFNGGKWSGSYYSDVPVILTAVSGSFKSWGGDVDSTDKTISITLDKVKKIQANF